MRYEPPIDAAVRGDWMPEGESYPALIVGRWNGWAIPAFDRATMERVIADQEPGSSNVKLSWREDAVLVTPDDDVPWEIPPGRDGRYRFDLGWIWDAVGIEDDPDEISPAQHASFVRMRESVRVDPMNRVAHGDGAHTFAITMDLGHRLDDEYRSKLHEIIGQVRVDRDGEATAVRELVPGESTTIVIAGYRVRVEHITDADGAHALRLSGIDCSLRGEQPGLYYPTPIKEDQ